MKRFIYILFLLGGLSFAADTSLLVVNGTYLGNEKRNYYGNVAPDSLKVIWKTPLGEGLTSVGQSRRIWKGCGWTGQPLLTWENDTLFVYQSAFDHNLKKVYAENGKIKWEYEYPDVIKGTGTIWSNTDKPLIMLGSRRGPEFSTWSSQLYNFRSVYLDSGEEAWRYHMKRYVSYSVDVDASPLIYRDTAYLGLENGRFIVFDPDPDKAESVDSHLEPLIYEKHSLFHSDDKKAHGYNLITEASPSRLGDHIYISSGAGHVYGYNLNTGRIDWDFYTGADMDGSTTVTYDNCILVTVEKQYIPGNGGVFKLDPSKAADSSCVVWYYPTGPAPKDIALWDGGVIGTATVNDLSRPNYMPHMAAFIGVDGYLYLVEHDKTDTLTTDGPNLQHRYHKPKFIASRWVGTSISTPIFAGSRILTASYSGLNLFEYTHKGRLIKLDKLNIGPVESTPYIYNKRIYVGTRSGFLYCLGD